MLSLIQYSEVMFEIAFSGGACRKGAEHRFAANTPFAKVGTHVTGMIFVERRGDFHEKNIHAPLWSKILVGIVLGLLLGFVSPTAAEYVSPLGDIF